MELLSISLDNKNNIIQTELKCILKSIKSNFIIKQIFCYLSKKKYLEIIKYSKKIQISLNIKINDYKEYMEKYSSIEIELKIIKNGYGKFINIDDKAKESFYHIYFNNEKEEKKRNYLNKEDNVSKIKIIIDNQITSFFELFKKCDCVELINFKKFYRNNITNMCNMFSYCKSLKYIYIS